MSAPPTASGTSEGFTNEGIRQKRSIGRSPFKSRVDKIGFAISHGFTASVSRQVARYFQSGTTSKQRWSIFLLVGGYDQLVGNQIARLSACGVVILSEFLSPIFDLNSSSVRNVLRGWISHGDVAAVWLTQPLTSSQNMSPSRRCCILRGAHQLTNRQSFEQCVRNVEDSSFRVRPSCLSRFCPLWIQQRSQSSRGCWWCKAMPYFLGLSWVTLSVSGIGMCAAWNTGASGR